MKPYLRQLVVAFTAVGIALGASTAHAGPVGTYYLTDNLNFTTSQSSLDAIQGSNYNQNATNFNFQEGAIAIVGNEVRTTGYNNGYSGGGYTSVPSLTVTADANTYTNGMIDPVTGFVSTYDGTTDGRFNYTVNFQSGAVIATSTNWGGTGSVLFSTGNPGDLGITYDNSNNSLWVQSYTNGIISDYSLSGALLSSFSTINGGFGSTALAMDVDHTLWYEHYGTGTIVHYDRNGNLLGTDFYAGLGYALGGEISAVPEPSSLALLGLGGIASAFGVYRRRRAAV